jgi:hypothetical protein
MADNITLNAMTGGSVVATDDSGATGHVQIIKLAISADGSATVIPADATYGLDVDVTRLPALAAGSNVIGGVTQSGSWTVTANAGTGTLAVIERGATIGHTSASVTTSAASVLASASTRRTITVQNLGTDYVWLGATGVTVGSGLRLAPGQTAVIDRSPNAQLFAIASSGTQSVSIFTESD